VVFLHRAELAWDAGKVVSALRGEGVAAADADALIAALRERVRDGDHVVFMSNGGFDGAPRRFLAVLKDAAAR
jgi:UDP-N-acetylmuramate: L-alanyl-gamma-D-glutamyl-meso-diaminopimelate ligase